MKRKKGKAWKGGKRDLPFRVLFLHGGHGAWKMYQQRRHHHMSSGNTQSWDELPRQKDQKLRVPAYMPCCAARIGRGSAQGRIIYVSAIL